MSLGLEIIDIGTVAGDNSGDPGRTAFDKINDNFATLETALENSLEDAVLKAFVVKCVAKDTVVAVGNAVEWWRQPYAFVVQEVRAAVFAEQSGSDIVVDI